MCVDEISIMYYLEYIVKNTTLPSWHGKKAFLMWINGSSFLSKARLAKLMNASCQTCNVVLIESFSSLFGFLSRATL